MQLGFRQQRLLLVPLCTRLLTTVTDNAANHLFWVWARIDDWEDRRFESDEVVWPVLIYPETNVLSEEWVVPGTDLRVQLVRERWTSSASRDLMMRRYLGEAEREVYDERLWMKVANLTGAAGNSTALVGTPEQVAEAMLRYYDLGCTTLILKGFDPVPDVVEFGKELLPMVREGAEHRSVEERLPAR